MWVFILKQYETLWDIDMNESIACLKYNQCFWIYDHKVHFEILLYEKTLKKMLKFQLVKITEDDVTNWAIQFTTKIVKDRE